MTFHRALPACLLLVMTSPSCSRTDPGASRLTDAKPASATKPAEPGTPPKAQERPGPLTADQPGAKPAEPPKPVEPGASSDGRSPLSSNATAEPPKTASATKPAELGTPPKAQERPGPLTADQIEKHLAAMGFEIPDGAVHSTITSVAGGVADGVMSYRSIWRPFGAPRESIGRTEVIIDYENKSKGAEIKCFIQSGRFFYFAETKETDAASMTELLRRINPALVQKREALAKTAARKSANRETVGDVILCVTPKGTILMSSKEPSIDGSFAEKFGLK